MATHNIDPRNSFMPSKEFLAAVAKPDLVVLADPEAKPDEWKPPLSARSKADLVTMALEMAEEMGVDPESGEAAPVVSVS